jgi:arsenite methyltransferase
MRSSLLELLVDPIAKTPLRLGNGIRKDGDWIIEGTLLGANEREFAVRNGIPRFVLTEDAGQLQTEESFGFKWKQQATYGSPEMQNTLRKWLVDRYGFSTVADMRSYFASRRRILDAGCGSGWSASLWLDADWRQKGSADWFGADISEAIDVAAQRLAPIPATNFLQADLQQLPFRPGTFDVIFSEGVLHHTPSTEQALKSIVPLLSADGEIMFYVYRKKGPVREFTDDYIRSMIASMPPHEAWETLRPLTKLGQALADANVEIELADDIPLLGIKAGRHNVQRLIYWHFAKLFWNPTMTFEENLHVNFDWYHPRYAHRQTEEQVRQWCADADLRITHMDVQESGLTVRAVRGPVDRREDRG